MTYISSHLEEEAKDIVKDAEKFLVRIKEAIKEIHDKSQS
ncbi:MAG: hypothetical protein MW690_000402 [Methanophagales archaeon]|nr:hypothetical protein [Methanophagales archaeon]